VCIRCPIWVISRHCRRTYGGPPGAFHQGLEPRAGALAKAVNANSVAKVREVMVNPHALWLTQITYYCLSAVSISKRANGALGEHQRHDTDVMRLEIAAPGCRSSVRRWTEPNCPHPGQENVSHGTPAAMAAPMVG
jgi:hypothetical protein